MRYAIETHHLTKHYGDIAAVNDLVLRVAEGEIYAFLGLNGAGKTTTIRMLLGMIKPTTGKVSVLGTKVHLGSRQPWAHVGYLVETPHAYPELTVYENLEVARRLHPGTPTQAIIKTIERLQLQPYAHKKASQLSLGNAQRLGLAKALLHNPSLLILDEPANGLDPAGIVEIRELLFNLAKEQGVTILMSSHNLSEVERMAQRLGIIHHGQLLQEMTIGELRQQRRKWLTVETRNPNAARATLIDAGYKAEYIQATQDTLTNTALHLTDAKAIMHPDEIATRLVHAHLAPTKLLVEEEQLENYFLRLIQSSIVPQTENAKDRQS